MTSPLPRLAAALADRYRIERELGAGGMATVYLAEDLKHKRHVAIKVLRAELAAVIGAERFVTEITTTANLQHPHILALHDSGAADGFLYYVMPYVEGESLRDRLSREKQLPIADAVRIAGEVASALDYAHRQGVIHRDIKPENILLHDGRALVADFGIALAATSAGSRMTETGMSLGTPHYMSPEQAMGERQLDARTDVYAVGCVLYEMLAGDPPFTGSTAQAIVAKVMTERPTALSTVRDTVPEEVEDAVLTSLAKLPADRFATAAEFAAALQGQGTGPMRRVRSRGPAAARPRPLLLGLLAATAAFALWGWFRPPPRASVISAVPAGDPDSHARRLEHRAPAAGGHHPRRQHDSLHGGRRGRELHDGPRARRDRGRRRAGHPAVRGRVRHFPGWPRVRGDELHEPDLDPVSHRRRDGEADPRRTRRQRVLRLGRRRLALVRGAAEHERRNRAACAGRPDHAPVRHQERRTRADVHPAG